MNIQVIIKDIEVRVEQSGFGDIRETTARLISHCVTEALRAYEKSKVIDNNSTTYK